MSIKQYKYPLLICLTLLLAIIIGPRNALADASWQNVGSPGFSAGKADWTSLAIDSSGLPYVVYSDGVNSWKATVMKYNGSSWQNVGSPGFSAGRADWTSIAIDNVGPPMLYIGIVHTH